MKLLLLLSLLPGLAYSFDFSIDTSRWVTSLIFPFDFTNSTTASDPSYEYTAWLDFGMKPGTTLNRIGSINFLRSSSSRVKVEFNGIEMSRPHGTPDPPSLPNEPNCTFVGVRGGNPDQGMFQCAVELPESFGPNVVATVRREKTKTQWAAYVKDVTSGNEIRLGAYNQAGTENGLLSRSYVDLWYDPFHCGRWGNENAAVATEVKFGNPQAVGADGRVVVGTFDKGFSVSMCGVNGTVDYLSDGLRVKIPGVVKH